MGSKTVGIAIGSATGQSQRVFKVNSQQDISEFIEMLRTLLLATIVAFVAASGRDPRTTSTHQAQPSPTSTRTPIVTPSEYTTSTCTATNTVITQVPSLWYSQ